MLRKDRIEGRRQCGLAGWARCPVAQKGLDVTRAQAGSQPASSDQICTWLGLPADRWPPDHYTLLGLPPGTADLALIERRVHDRLDTVRRYQLSHPEPATDAMNRLAQALVCLSNPAEKKVYDARLLGRSLTVIAPSEPEPSSPVTTSPPTPPPQTAEPTEPTAEAPVVLPEIPLLPAEMAEPQSSPVAQPGAVTAPVPTETTTAPIEPVWTDPNETAGRTGAARRGIGSKRALYRRIVRTRRLIAAWETVGGWLAYPKKRFKVANDGPEFVRQMQAVQQLAVGFPVLGEAGQPGYFVLGLARGPKVAETFRSYQPRQRESVARDWNAGKTLLRAHAQFLRQEVRSMRKKSQWAWTKRTVRALLADHPYITLLILLGVLALIAALWRTLETSEWLSRQLG